MRSYIQTFDWHCMYADLVMGQYVYIINILDLIKNVYIIISQIYYFFRKPLEKLCGCIIFKEKY